MPPPPEHLVKRLGPAVEPFERIKDQQPSLRVREGEAIPFNSEIYDATDGGRPKDVITVALDSINSNDKHGRYLWVINENGLWMLLEAIVNTKAERGNMCHTNITGGEKALQGGEMWFDINFDNTQKVYINYDSGRYGATEDDQKKAVIEYFQLVGYIVEVVND